MTNLPLSVLDVALIETGTTAAQALAHTETLAQHAQQLGYRRFWVAEHHTAGVASASPAVVIEHIASQTSTLRVGAGGVLLPNHAPLVVAEQFGTLGAFHPGRIDLGIGRGAGTEDAATAVLLRHGAPVADPADHEHDLDELIAYFQNDDDDAVAVTARAETAPEIWVLSSSASSAAHAARLGLPLSFAHHIRPANTAEAVSRYRAEFRPSRWLSEPRVMVSVAAVVADTDERANELARPFETYLAAQLLTGRAATVPTAEQARAHTPGERETAFLDARRSAQIQGSPTTAARQFAEIVAATTPDEMMVLTPVYNITDRLRSFELLAEIAQLG